MRKNKRRNDEFKFPQDRRLPVGILAAGVIIFVLYFDKTLNQSESCDIFCRLSRVMLWLLYVTSIIMPIVFLCQFFCNR